MTPPPPHPIIIIGAGISGLLLAHFLSHHSIPFQIYERRPNLNTLNEGWGLTLHWSLPTLRELMGEALFARLPETYVDRGAVERGEGSRFPFFDLSTGEEKARTPVVGEGERVRVGRQALRRLLAGGLNIMVGLYGFMDLCRRWWVIRVNELTIRSGEKHTYRILPPPPP